MFMDYAGGKEGGKIKKRRKKKKKKDVSSIPPSFISRLAEGGPYPLMKITDEDVE